MAFGFLLLVKGADWFVEGTSGIADKMHIPQLVIGLTIVAMGTSAPEAAVSITAALEKSAEFSVGNVVGSNIFNILMILGITGVIIDVPFESSFLIDCGIAAFAGILLWLCVFRKKKLKLIDGIIMLASYATYFVYLVVK